MKENNYFDFPEHIVAILKCQGLRWVLVRNLNVNEGKGHPY